MNFNSVVKVASLFIKSSSFEVENFYLHSHLKLSWEGIFFLNLVIFQSCCSSQNCTYKLFRRLVCALDMEICFLLLALAFPRASQVLPKAMTDDCFASTITLPVSYCRYYYVPSNLKADNSCDPSSLAEHQSVNCPGEELKMEEIVCEVWKVVNSNHFHSSKVRYQGDLFAYRLSTKNGEKRTSVLYVEEPDIFCFLFTLFQSQDVNCDS